MRRRGLTATLAVVGIVVFMTGCGAEDFDNNPRPPAPIELTARINDERVIISPIQVNGEPVGAGLANITISNQTSEDVQLNFTGPVDQQTDPIVAEGVLEFKINLDEGDYLVSANQAGIKDFEFEVGPERPSAQNELLLP